MKGSLPKTILLAEDDSSISEVMKIILEDAGYQVDLAPSYQAVMDAVQTSVPSMLFLDVRLGGESGEDIAKKLRANKKTADMAIIILSADEKIKEIAERSGATGFLPKPFDMMDLLALSKKYAA